MIGRTIMSERMMTPREAELLGWDDYYLHRVYVLDDGSYLVASKDDEGNGPGVIWHMDDAEFDKLEEEQDHW